MALSVELDVLVVDTVNDMRIDHVGDPAAECPAVVAALGVCSDAGSGRSGYGIEFDLCGGPGAVRVHQAFVRRGPGAAGPGSGSLDVRLEPIICKGRNGACDVVFKPRDVVG